MKRITLCLLGCTLFVLPIHAENHTQPRGVIYYCGEGNACSFAYEGSLLLMCPVPCGSEARMGDLHSFTPSIRGIPFDADQNQYITPEGNWTLEAPQIFRHGPSELPGSVWTPSPAERYLHDMGAMGLPGQ